MQIDEPPSKKCLVMFKAQSERKQMAKNNRKHRKAKKKKLRDEAKEKREKKLAEFADKKEPQEAIFESFTNTIKPIEDKELDRRKLLNRLTPEDKVLIEAEELCATHDPKFLSPQEILQLRRFYNDLSLGDYVLVFPNPDNMPPKANHGVTLADAMEIYDNYIQVTTDDKFITREEKDQKIAFKKAFLALGDYQTEEELEELRIQKVKSQKNARERGESQRKPEEKVAVLDRKGSKEALLLKNDKMANGNKKDDIENPLLNENGDVIEDPKDLTRFYKLDLDCDKKKDEAHSKVKKNYCKGGFMVSEKVPDSDDKDWVCSNMPPKDFLTLVRNTIVTKFVRTGHMHVRSFLTSDANYIAVVLKAEEERIKMEAEEARMDKQMELGACDLFSLEPVDNKGRPLRVKPYVRKAHFPKDFEPIPDIEKMDRGNGASVSSRAQSMFQKLMKMTDLQLQFLIVEKQKEVDGILIKVAKTQNMELVNKTDLFEDDSDVGRETWETYYIYLAYIQELLTKVEKEANAIKKKKGLPEKEPETKEKEKTGAEETKDGKKEKKKKEKIPKSNDKKDYVIPEMKENEFFLYKLVFLKAFGDSNEVSYAFYHSWCLSCLGLESEDVKNRLKNIWHLLGTDPIPPYMKYTRQGGDMWRSYEKNERGQRSKFLHMERLKIVNKIIAKHVNLLKLVKKGLVCSLLPLHDGYQMDGDFNIPLFKKLYNEKILLEPQDNFGEKRVKQYFVMMADEAEKTDFDTDGSSLADDIAYNWSRPWQINVESLRNYFGEKIAMYFNFLSFYTLFLLPMAFLSIIAQGVQDNASLMVSNGMKMAFSVLIIIWSTIFIELWKRKESLFAVQFGQKDTELVEAERPNFKGRYIRSIHNDDINVLYFSPLKKAFRIFLAYVISIIILTCVVVCVILIQYFKKYLTDCNCVDMTNSFVAAIPSIINAIQIQIFNMIYQNVALALNEFENHKLLSQYENSLVFKIFAFSFVNTFNSLVIISFMSSLFPGIGLCTNSTTGIDDCFDAVAVQMRTLFLTAFFKNFLEITLPYVMLTIKEKRKKKNSKPLEHPFLAIDQKIEEQIDKSPYAANLEVDGTLEDYMELVIQFGFLTLFAVNFPIAYLMAFLTNIIEIQVDKTKIVKFKRRPTPENAKNLGTWFLILDFLSFLSIFFNAALIAYTSTCIYMQDDATKNKVFVLFIFLFLGIKYLIKLLIPDVPEKTKRVEMRHDFIKTRIEQGFSGQNRNKMKQSKVILSIEGLAKESQNLNIKDYQFAEEEKARNKAKASAGAVMIDVDRKDEKKRNSVLEMGQIKKKSK